MLLGILRMPYSTDERHLRQLHSCCLRAADRIEADAMMIAALRIAVEALELEVRRLKK